MVAPASVACAAGEVEHLVGHVQPVGEPARPDAAGREEHVEAGAGTEVEHGLALEEVGDRERVAAAEAGRARTPGVGELSGVVGVAAHAGRVGLGAARGQAGADLAGRGGVAGADPLARHGRPVRVICGHATHPQPDAVLASVTVTPGSVDCLVVRAARGDPAARRGLAALSS